MGWSTLNQLALFDLILYFTPSFMKLEKWCFQMLNSALPILQWRNWAHDTVVSGEEQDRVVFSWKNPGCQTPGLEPQVVCLKILGRVMPADIRRLSQHEYTVALLKNKVEGKTPRTRLATPTCSKCVESIRLFCSIFSGLLLRKWHLRYGDRKHLSRECVDQI